MLLLVLMLGLLYWAGRGGAKESAPEPASQYGFNFRSVWEVLDELLQTREERGEALDDAVPAKIKQREYLRRGAAAHQAITELRRERELWTREKVRAQSKVNALQSCSALFAQAQELLTGSRWDESEALDLAEAEITLKAILAPAEHAAKAETDYVPTPKVQELLSGLGAGVESAITNYRLRRAGLGAVLERADTGGCE